MTGNVLANSGMYTNGHSSSSLYNNFKKFYDNKKYLKIAMFCCVTVRSARILANGSIFAPEKNALF